MTCSQTQLAWALWRSLNFPLVKVMWQHRHASNVRLVPSSFLWHGSPPASVEGAACHMFVPPLFHPSDQRLAVALAAPEGRMIYLLPFSPPYPFVFSHRLCSRVHDQPPAIFYPCAALLAVSLLRRYTTVAITLLPLIWADGTCDRTPKRANRYAAALSSSPFVHAYLLIKRCGSLGWSLNGFDTHYQLSLMWN